jgi:hypothetical protein
MTTNTPSIDRFVDELRADPLFSGFADEVRTQLMGVDRKADDCPDHAAYFSALQYVFTHEDHSLAERLEQLSRLSNLKKGYVVVNLQEFTGW